MNIYGVKSVLTNIVGGGKRFYEEIILSVRASSYDEAYEKADAYLKDYCSDYVNLDGETVSVSGYELLDCFLAFDEENDVREIYSCITTNKTKTDEKKFYDIITSQCDKEELYPLRNAELV